MGGLSHAGLADDVRVEPSIFLFNSEDFSFSSEVCFGEKIDVFICRHEFFNLTYGVGSLIYDNC